MAWVALSVGSNKHARENFHSCLDMLLLQFKDLALSSVFESASATNNAQRYLNMAVGFETEMPLAELVALLKKIEDKHGRQRAVSTSPALTGDEITLDLDLLLYANKAGNFNGVVLPHPDVLTKVYVLRPLTQIAGQREHPLSKRKLSELAKLRLPELIAAGQSLTPVSFLWHGRELSRHG